MGERQDEARQRLMAFSAFTSSRDEESREAPRVLAYPRFDEMDRPWSETLLEYAWTLFGGLLQHLPDGVVLSRLDDGTVLGANEAARRLPLLFWVDPTGAVGEAEWVDPAQRQAILNRMHQSEVVQERGIRIKEPSGAIRLVQGLFQEIRHGEEALLLSVVSDVTRQQTAEQALQEYEATLLTLYDTVSLMMGVVEIHGERLYHVICNQAMADYLDMTTEELQGRYVQRMGIDKASVQQWIESFKQSKAEGFSNHYTYRHDIDGVTRWLRITVAYIQTLPTGIDRYSYVISDVTQEKETEQHLTTAKEHAEKVARLRAAILNNITHEVRTPLTGILGFTQALRRGIKPGYERFVDLIERSGHRLLLMLDSILDLAQLESGRMEIKEEPVDVLLETEQIVRLIRPVAEAKGLRMHIQTEEGSARARMDQRIFRRVVHHLLDNAVKFTSKGEILIRTYEEEADIVLVIRDTGIGIDPEFLPVLFDEFAQESTGLERTYQGSGLGLTVSKQLLEAAGGSIEVESTKGEGSTFTLRMPRLAA